MKPLVIVVPLALMALVSATEDFAETMFSRSLDSVEKCYEVRNSCTTCYHLCPSAKSTFFGGTSSSPAHLASVIRTCRVQMSNHRTGMEPWCINDWRRFFSTGAFKPDEESCTMEPTECAQRMFLWAKQQHVAGKLSKTHPDYVLAEKMASVGRAVRLAKRSETWYNGQVQKYKRLEQWWKEDILTEMMQHLREPAANNTRFSDPVYYNLTGLKKETQRVDLYLYRNDLMSARVENQFVKRDTLGKISQYLSSIGSLKNLINSHKSVVDGYLKEIKHLVTMIYQAQVKANNFAYETTHMHGLDGDLISLDKELLEMFKELREERALFNHLNTMSTVDKVRLTGAMRRLVVEITHAQRKARCKHTDMFGI